MRDQRGLGFDSRCVHTLVSVMDEPDFVIQMQPVEPAKWRWSKLSYVTARLARDCVGAVERAVAEVAVALAANHNWLVDQDDFAEQARRDMESLSGRR